MPDQDHSIPYQCRNYESILSATSLLPDPAETLSEEAGCDTCFHHLNGKCAIFSSNSEMEDSFGLTT